MAEGGAADALHGCSSRASKIMEKVSRMHGVLLRRATLPQRNPDNAADETERVVLAAFLAALRNCIGSAGMS
jgi:hypothetical protein